MTHWFRLIPSTVSKFRADYIYVYNRNCQTDLMFPGFRVNFGEYNFQDDSGSLVIFRKPFSWQSYIGLNQKQFSWSRYDLTLAPIFFQFSYTVHKHIHAPESSVYSLKLPLIVPYNLSTISVYIAWSTVIT